MAADAGEPALCDLGRVFGRPGAEPNRNRWGARTAATRAGDSFTVVGGDPAAQPGPMPSRGHLFPWAAPWVRSLSPQVLAAR